MKIKSIRVPNTDISIGEGVFVIAEAGKNFIQTKEEKSTEEYLKNAKELARLAKEAGADAIKFQTHNVTDEQANISVVSPHFSGSDRYSWVKRNTESTPIEFWKELKAYCDSIGIIFFSTPMSRGAAEKLTEVGVNLWKVGSGDILDFVTLDYMAQSGKPIIISSGMSTLEEIDTMMKFLKKRNAQVILLHCVSKYPCPPEELNLMTIPFLAKRYGIVVGFSDHSIGYDSAVAATNLGAKVIEKHFSLSRSLYGADHKVSMTADEFKTMVQKIRKGEKIALSQYGREEKFLHDDEAVFRPLFRKSLVWGGEAKKGTIVTSDMVYAMRPQAYLEGLPSEQYEMVIGKKLTRDTSRFEAVKKTDIE
ncbi:N-acetylneuraminate synthase family protein [Candidatus Parcubacteria bacterium]|nr:N-acetylneuraminate synthase family protein [Candidatus Parcubacteria bacterium]